MHIRRDRSSLHFDRRGGPGTRLLLGVWLVVMVVALAIIVRFETVQNWVQDAVSGEPTAAPDAITLAQRGERAYLAGDLDGAVTYYGQALALAPADVDIAFEYVRALVYRSYNGDRYARDVDQALATAHALAAQLPDSPQAQVALCLALQESGQLQAAIGAGLRAVASLPDYGEAWACLALAYYQDDRPNQAFEAAQQAVTLAPNSVDARRALAITLAFRGEPQAAIQQYEQAIQLHPYLDALYFELAWYYLSQQNYDAATAAYDRVLALDPQNVKAYTRECYAYFVTGEFEQAQEACQQAVLLDPAYSEAYQWLGKVDYMRRNYEGTIEALDVCVDLQVQQGISLAEREVDCYYVRGLALALLDNCDEAMPALQDALLMDPNPDVEQSIYQGMRLCVDSVAGTGAGAIPTPAPTATPLPEPIPIY